jgi:hypothetical protein
LALLSSNHFFANSIPAFSASLRVAKIFALQNDDLIAAANLGSKILPACLAFPLKVGILITDAAVYSEH